MFYMFAYVVRLTSEPPLQFSLIKGFAGPKFFTDEWRYTSQMQGMMIGMDMGSSMHAGKRETGASLETLAEVRPAEIAALGGLNMLSSDLKALDALLDGGLRQKIAAAAGGVLQYEISVTPSSVCIYTVCAPYAILKSNLSLASEIADAVGNVDITATEDKSEDAS
jgi:hypothetical protein